MLIEISGFHDIGYGVRIKPKNRLLSLGFRGLSTSSGIKVLSFLGTSDFKGTSTSFRHNKDVTILRVFELYSINGSPSSFNEKKTRIKPDIIAETLTGQAFQTYEFIKYLIPINEKHPVFFTLS